METHFAACRAARAFAIALMAVTCWVATVPAQAADYRLIVLDGYRLKWGSPELGTGATVTYAIADRYHAFKTARNCQAIAPIATLLETSAIARQAFEQAAAAAFKTWSDVANIRFKRVDEADADILIGAQFRPMGRAFTNVEYNAGPEDRDDASLSRSVICLNPEQQWKMGFDGNLEVYDIEYVLTHEIGHAIGLNHPGHANALMDFRYREQFQKLQFGDIAGAVALYGPSPTLTASTPNLLRRAADMNGGESPDKGLAMPEPAAQRD